MIDIFELTGETSAANIQGASVTSTGLKPVQYLQEIFDGAKKNMQFAGAIRELTVAPGHYELVIPKRKKYFFNGDATWNTAGSDNGGSGAGVGPYANTQATMTFTAYDKMSNVTAKPIPYIFSVSFRRWDLETNLLNLMEFAKEDLIHAISDKIDVGVATAVGDATASTSSVAGCQVLFGGDATSDNTLATGDILTTDLIAKAKRRLSDSRFFYRASGQYGAETLADATYTKNRWTSTPDDPFILYFGPAQEEALEKDSQFVNASEYGGREVILNGEIGKLKYLGIKLVMSDNVERVASGGTSPDGYSTTGADMARCILMKAKSAAALVWGKKPEVRSWDYEDQDSVRVGVFAYYDIKVVQDDAIVLIDVAENAE